MNKFNKLTTSAQIMFDFFKSGSYRGEETLEEDLKRFVENNPKWKKKIEYMKKKG